MTLSPEKTQITHVDDGFELLGFRIVRRPRPGHAPVAYSFPSKRALREVIHRITELTGRTTTNLSLEALIHALNPVLRGWTNYHRHGASKRCFAYLSHYLWGRVVRWLRKKYPRLTWKQIKRRYWQRTWNGVNGARLAWPAEVAITRYRFRYADDLVVMCGTEAEARRALAALRTLLAELGLEPKQAKTRIVHLRDGGEGFDFLGFHHRYVRGRTRRSRNITFLARWPSRQAMQHARDRIRELTARERLLLPVEEVVQDINGFLRGWVGYFRYGNSARPFDEIDRYAITRLSLFVAKRHRAPTRYGWKLVAYESPNRMGLINLNGRVIAPRPNRPWREKPNVGGERRR